MDDITKKSIAAAFIDGKVYDTIVSEVSMVALPILDLINQELTYIKHGPILVRAVDKACSKYDTLPEHLRASPEASVDLYLIGQVLHSAQSNMQPLREAVTAKGTVDLDGLTLDEARERLESATAAAGRIDHHVMADLSNGILFVLKADLTCAAAHNVRLYQAVQKYSERLYGPRAA
ncbi:MAG: hypothetical protein KJ601_07230 [Nanoarchaeota archaeon]|nr:hypothetical protein [Nanoarchaeota archaeon]